MYKFLLICGVSGSGKSFIEQQLVNKQINPEVNFNRLIQVTTRPMRDEEVDGQDYIFVSDSEYENMKDNLLAKTQFYNNKYGTLNQTKKYEDNGLNINTIVVNREGNDAAIRDIKKLYPENEILTIQIKNRQPVAREGRSKEDLIQEINDLNEVMDLEFYNDPEERLDIKKLIKTLYEMGFINERKFY